MVKKGKLVYEGTLHEDSLSVKGSLLVTQDVFSKALSVSGKTTILGNVKSDVISCRGDFIVKGKIDAGTIDLSGKNILSLIKSKELYVNGAILADLIESDITRIEYSDQSTIKKIMGKDISIKRSDMLEGHNNIGELLEDINTTPIGKFFGHFLNIMMEKKESFSGNMEIDEIQGESVVLEDCHVKKVIAKNIVQGNNATIDEKILV